MRKAWWRTPQGKIKDSDRVGKAGAVPTRGMITNINYGRGCGFIQPDTDPDGRSVYFEQAAVEGTAFAELRFGDYVTYELHDEPPPPAELRAARVLPE
ncbi:MAG TPA: hypothetical protein VIL85_22745 [Thermomicrobiales bacterium]|jgi:cold shock CspA family protein